MPQDKRKTQDATSSRTRQQYVRLSRELRHDGVQEHSIEREDVYDDLTLATVVGYLRLALHSEGDRGSLGLHDRGEHLLTQNK